MTAQTEKMVQTAEGTAYGKLILIGEHAVVYGYPAIAMPFKWLQVQVHITPASGPIILDSALYNGKMDEAPQMLDGLVKSVKEALSWIGARETGFAITICSDVPTGRGLGSSAAVTTATMRALMAYFDCEMSAHRLLALLHTSELVAHGTPSGLDAATVMADGPIWYKNGERITPFSLGGCFHMVVADTGHQSDTASAVQGVRQYVTSEPAKGKTSLLHINEGVRDVGQALKEGAQQKIGRAFHAVQRELEVLGVSNSPLQQLITAANQAGALGAKLTGGGRGGCMLALAQDEAHANELQAALSDAGAHHVWHFSIGGEEQT